MLHIHTLPFNMFGVNTYILWNSDTDEAAVIDPGMCNTRERYTLDSFISQHGLQVKQLINTHMHVDHIFGDLYIKEKYGTPIQASPLDAFLGDKADMQCRMFGLPGDMASVGIDVELTDGMTINLCGLEAHILSVPGHSPGSIVIYLPEAKAAFTGDVLFQGSIGRTDLVAGNHSQLINGIKTKLMALPDDTVVYPGHGSPTTIGAEKRSNPYIR